MPEGSAAGDIARKLDVLPNTLSANLTVLANAGLVKSRREGRSIIYSADYDRMSSLLGFLMEDCCNGDASICAPLLAITSRAASLPISAKAWTRRGRFLTARRPATVPIQAPASEAM